MKILLALTTAAAALLIANGAAAQSRTIASAACGGNASAVVADRGMAVDAKTGRSFFLEYPCDIKAGEKLTFVLNLHGAGSSSGWQRQYFPIPDFVQRYRLIVATPMAATLTPLVPGGRPVRRWDAAADDAHLQNIVDAVYAGFGPAHIRAFWLAGHSQGGATSHRIVCTDYFKDKVDGFVSLAGGRVGMTATAPTCGFSHIFTTGDQDTAGVAGVPATSPMADRFKCAARVKRGQVIDTIAGKVSDGRTAETGRPDRPGWGGLPGPGTADVFVFPGCSEGRVVADVIRLKKGHTEGLEPKVTEEIVKLMVSAKAG